MEKNNNVTQDKLSVLSQDIEYENLKVNYDDPSVLTTNSEELETVNKFFNDITCGDKEIENLLYEVIGYSLAKTAKLNKAFIFKGSGRNRKV